MMLYLSISVNVISWGFAHLSYFPLDMRCSDLQKAPKSLEFTASKLIRESDNLQVSMSMYTTYLGKLFEILTI